MASLKSLSVFARHYMATYASAAPRILYRMTLSALIDPRGTQKFLHDSLDAMDFASEDRILGSVDVRELFPGDGEVVLRAPFHTTSLGGTCQLLELGALAHVVRSLGARTIFEIGTFTGRTTRLFALNAAPGARIFTLDLPQAEVAHRIGRDFEGTPEEAQITKLSGDSTAFDYAPWRGQCDFVWIDGNHDYPFVSSDTKAALELCRPGGWIGWHDYWHTGFWYGVTRSVRGSRDRFPLIRHVRGTTIVLARTHEEPRVAAATGDRPGR